MDKGLEHYSEEEFNLASLVETASTLIAKVIPTPEDGRVAKTPDARTVRYYQTIGILRRPLRYEGRNAVYGYPHLLQLITIKLLQSQGLSLAQIQRALIQTTTSQLESELRSAMENYHPKIRHEGGSRKGEFQRKPTLNREFDSKGNSSRIDPLQALEIPLYRKSPGFGTRAMIAAEIAPGISIIIDPDEVDHPEGVIARITRLLQNHKGENE